MIEEGAWPRAKLGEIVVPARTRVSPADFPDMMYVGLEHIDPREMTCNGHGYARDIRSSCYVFQEGDVLYGRMRPNLNKVWVAEFSGLCSGEFLVFEQRAGLDSYFLAAWLNSTEFVSFACEHVRGERPRVNFEKLAQFELLLPPPDKQKEIAENLRETFGKLSRARTAAGRALSRLKTYERAVFDAAVSGTIFEKNGRSSSVRDGWKVVSFGEHFAIQNGMVFPSDAYSSKGIRLLRPGNMYADGTIGWTEKNTRFLPLAWAEQHPRLLVGGYQLVVNLTAQSLKDEFLGRVCLTSPDEQCLLNQRIARLTPASGSAKFFLCVFKSTRFRQFLEGLNSGSLIQHIYASVEF